MKGGVRIVLGPCSNRAKNGKCHFIPIYAGERTIDMNSVRIFSGYFSAGIWSMRMIEWSGDILLFGENMISKLAASTSLTIPPW
jgi:hypothetical protein